MSGSDSQTQAEQNVSDLIQINGTWSRHSPQQSQQQGQGRLSAAKIYESASEQGRCWTVVSPITFTYRVLQCGDLLDEANDALLWGHVGDPGELRALRARPGPVRRLVVVDETVHALHGDRLARYFRARGVACRILPLPTTEENKSLELVTRVLEEAHALGLDRRAEPILAVGGGVCLDVVGLAASLYRRRTPYVRVPTTLLAYVDASVGAKTGVNFAGGKNKLGSYAPPAATLLDRGFLRSLPRRHLANGMAEMLKMALMKHRGLFELLEAEGPNMLNSSFQSPDRTGAGGPADAATESTRVAIETMLEELAPNLWEDDLDRLVDFGHLISPELEMTVLPALLHGEAVAVDMSFMLFVAGERGLLAAPERSRVLGCMRRLELPVHHAACSLGLVRRALAGRLRHSGGSVRMPLPTGLGRAEIFHDISDETLCEAYSKWSQELSAPERES